MEAKEITRRIEERYPKGWASSWDNVGLLVGRENKDVGTIYLALDATDEVIEEAVQCSADLLITHHPMIFSGMKQVRAEDFIGRRIIRLIQSDISYYAMHTNYDVMGMAAAAADRLGLAECRVLEPVEYPAGEEGSVVQGFGRIGRLPLRMSVEECAMLVKERFHLSNVKVFGSTSRPVSLAAIAPGSGKSMLQAALDAGVEVIITGDIDHHEGIDAGARGLTVIDAGHYGIEHIFIDDVEQYLTGVLDGVTIRKEPVRHPFQVL